MEDDPLIRSDLEVLGRMPWSSNATFLVKLADGTRAVYKPVRGERPLWDFPAGLHRRERATYLVSEALGWGLVPRTVMRSDGPFGPGCVQSFVDADFAQHYFTICDRPGLRAALRRLCALDIVTNAADRKSGHVLLDANERIWAIDNGLTFHVDDKLRTVVWDFAGEAIDPPVVEGLCALLAAGPPDELTELLDPNEVTALMTRVETLLERGRFPLDPTGRRIPWPLV